ncbi:Slufate transporter 2,1 [Hibiscus syriacus]|uniref:Slufate transporter 2,1 n=1 Tax=Hibiscus syriacus TaxID=106335 RepID=A0A6A2XEX7_HIBSY|nr:chaperone protein dnaJ 20, chloroplastic-like [Hibiscus syriacus]KAE8665735.1 Slufate transporter 2,1 [Hibiscus syriacus]
MAISMEVSLNPSRLVSTNTKLGFRRMKVQAVSCGVDGFAAAERGKSSFYKVLSLDSENVGLAEIKKAYRRMVLQYHPDVCSPSSKEESTQRFLELQTAYGTLSDPISRQIYDYELSLVNSIGFGFGNYTMNERRRSNVRRDVKKRSNVTRMQRMKNR